MCSTADVKHQHMPSQPVTNTKFWYHLSTLLLASTLWKGATVPVFLSRHVLLGFFRKVWARTEWPPQVTSVALLQGYCCVCLYRYLFIYSHRLPKTEGLANISNLCSGPSFCCQKIFLATNFILLHLVPTGRTDKLNCFRSCLYIRKDHVPLAPALHLTVPQSSCLPVRWWPTMLSPCLGLLCLQPPQPINACLQARYLKLDRAVPEKSCQCGRAPRAS